MIIYFWTLFLISVLVSQSAMDFFSILFCGAWIWMYWKAKKGGQPRPLLTKFGLESVWILWIIIVGIGYILHPLYPSYELIRIIEFKWILILYVMIGILLLYRPDRRNLNFLIGYMLFFAGTNLLLYFADFPFLTEFRYGSTEGGFLRAGGFFADPMTFAHSFVIFFCLFLGVALLNFKEMTLKQRAWSAVALVLSVVSLILTYTRGVWIGLTLSVLITFFFWRPKYSISLAVLFAAMGLGLYQFSPTFQWRVNRTIEEFNGESDRKVLWKGHGLIFKENPTFGLGYGQNTKELRKYYDRLGVREGMIESHAHNQFLHLLAGTGVLGLLCYLSLWLFFYVVLIRLWRLPEIQSWDRGWVLGALLAQTAFLIGGMTEANFEHSKVRFALMIMWSYIVYLGFKYDRLVNWNFNWKKRG